MKIFYCILLFVSILFNSSAQNTGLYGKRNFIEFNTASYIPVFSWILENGEMYKTSGAGNSLVVSNDKFNYGFHFVVGHAGKKNTGISLEFGYDFANIPGPSDARIEYTDQWGYDNYYYVYLKHERLDINTFSIMPKIEFTRSGGTLPVGLNHQFGFGYTSSSVREKDYVYRITGGGDYISPEDSANFESKLINYDKKYKGYSFLYAFNIRTPISKKIMINYGIRYTLNFRNYAQYFSNSDYHYEEYDIARKIGKMRFTNFITFNLGVSYAF